jgi:hypothetical protein
MNKCGTYAFAEKLFIAGIIYNSVFEQTKKN